MPRRKPLRIALVAMIWLGIWAALAAWVGQSLLLPSPLQTARALGGLLGQSAYWLGVMASVGRIVLGFALGLLAGVALAVISRRFAFCNDFLKPLLAAVKATPVASFIVLALVWMRTGQVPVFATFLVVLPGVWANTAEGLASTDPDLLEMAKGFGMGRRAVLSYIVWPSVRPYLRAAVRAGMGMAWKAGVAAEIISLPKNALGEWVYTAKIYLDTPRLFAATIVVVALSVALERAVVALTRERALRVKEASAASAALVAPEPLAVSGAMLRFGDKAVLDHFDCHFAAGETTCLIGASGCGKTTLLRVLAGLLPLQGGSVRLHPGRAAFVFQEDRLLPWFGALDNLRAVGIPREAALQALAAVGLSGEADTRPAELSGGMRRRLAIARAIALKSDVFFLDEPLRGLDEETARPVLARLEAAIAGKTALLITHNAEELAALATREVRVAGLPMRVLGQ
ncbi:MAG: ATP-binding cassette domain-containing protein [Oscillospiraceae bacterium]|jgi:NitT/TauT family transport system permease protein|nr:ATP-binding cassette domain-containing protein [Oscillospiraceae bacterium]